MPDPLDYRNPRSADADNKIDRRPPGPRAVIPVEFDTLLTRTDDHAAARAIENELQRLGIPLFRSEAGEPAQRSIEIHIHAADFETAGPVAAEIFVRRKKIKSIPRPKPIDNLPSSMRPGGLGGFGGFGF